MFDRVQIAKLYYSQLIFPRCENVSAEFTNVALDPRQTDPNGP